VVDVRTNNQIPREELLPENYQISEFMTLPQFVPSSKKVAVIELKMQKEMPQGFSQTLAIQHAESKVFKKFELPELRENWDEAVGEAFYLYCLEFVVTNPVFDKRKIPITNSKRENFINNLHTFYIFLKREYVLKNKGIERIQLSKLFKKYISALNFDAKRFATGHPPIYKKYDIKQTNRDIANLLRAIGFNSDKHVKKSTGNKTFITISHLKNVVSDMFLMNMIMKKNP
jgi:hypothetical protein